MNIVEEIKKIPEVTVMNGCSDEQIAVAQNELGVTFPQEFIDYVKAFGCIDFYSTEWTGLNIEGRLNVVDATKKEMSVNPDFPKGFFVLENMGIDSKVIVVDSEGSVYLLQNANLEKISNSISEYLQKCIERK